MTDIKKELDINEDRSCDEALNNLECKIRENFPWKDSFYSYERDEKGFLYAVVNWEKLNIAFRDPQKLIDTLLVIDHALKTDNKIFLYGYLHWRFIVEKLPFFENLFKKKSVTLIQSWWNKTDKNNIEELFIFIMNQKWIDSSKWIIKWPICKWPIDEACINALWNRN